LTGVSIFISPINRWLMKRTTTLLLFLLICLNLSAYNHRVDTGKALSSVAQKDSLQNLKYLAVSDFSITTNHKNIYSVAVLNHKTDIDLLAPAGRQSEFSLSAISYPDSVNYLASTTNKSGTLSMADSHLAENPSNKQRIKNADSLRLLAVMIRQDSIRSAVYRLNRDSVKQRLAVMNVDSLRLQLKLPAADLYKGLIFNEMANRYLGYDTISNRTTRVSYQSRALSYTMLSLHEYSRLNDSIGLRVSFDHLAKIYLSQRKYSQAKWFILQSNTLSRARKDAPNIISSLMTLATIKGEQNDYLLAASDLNEAITISQKNHLQNMEMDVLKNYAMLYSRQKNYPKEELMLKKRDSIAESIKKAEEAKQLAALSAKDSADKKKADSLNKKKVLSSNTRKLSKGNSGKKIASL